MILLRQSSTLSLCLFVLKSPIKHSNWRLNSPFKFSKGKRKPCVPIAGGGFSTDEFRKYVLYARTGLATRLLGENSVDLSQVLLPVILVGRLNERVVLRWPREDCSVISAP